MSDKEATPLFKKVGRKYVPVHAQWHEDHSTDQMPVGTFRLTYAYADGGRRYEYEVTPATAPTVAAMMVAKSAIEDAVKRACVMRPNIGRPYTKRQQAAIERFKEEMGGMYPSWWVEGSAYEISDAAIKAVMEFQP